MKHLFTLILLLQINLSFGGTFPRLIASITNPGGSNPLENITTPSSGKQFFLWEAIVFDFNSSIIDTYIEISGNEIDLFLERSSPSVILDPPAFGAYNSIAEFNGLDPDLYNLNYYIVPAGSQFPPSDIDAPMFFQETIQINVLDAVVIDTLSQFSLLLIIVSMMLVGLIVLKRKTSFS